MAAEHTVRGLPRGKEGSLSVYICTVCGYDYDEAAGDPRHGIPPGTRWEDVPADWVCPVCGADKSMFENQGGKAETPAPAPMAAPAGQAAPQQGADAKRLSATASNLARAAQKQHRAGMADLFTQLADFFDGQSSPAGDWQTAADLLKEDLAGRYPAAFAAARADGDRGALRALNWGEKVGKIQANLLKRYNKEGDAAFEGSAFFVCEACGFIFVGEQAPEICPVCKVPRFKFARVGRGASA